MRIKGQESIAEVFGVAPKTIVEWQEQGLPIAVRGKPGVPSEYDTDACIAWMVEREIKKIQAERPQDRLARLQADKIEIELAERRGVLIPADLLEPRLQAAFTAARERWLEVAPRLAREFTADAAAREALLQAEFESFLHRLADWANAGVDEGDDE